jgi:hypothetical protein
MPLTLKGLVLKTFWVRFQLLDKPKRTYNSGQGADESPRGWEQGSVYHIIWRLNKCSQRYADMSCSPWERQESLLQNNPVEHWLTDCCEPGTHALMGSPACRQSSIGEYHLWGRKAPSWGQACTRATGEQSETWHKDWTEYVKEVDR